MWFLNDNVAEEQDGGLQGIKKMPTQTDIDRADRLNKKFDALNIPRYAVCGGKNGVMFKAVRESCNDKPNIGSTGETAVDKFLQKTYGFSLATFERDSIMELQAKINVLRTEQKQAAEAHEATRKQRKKSDTPRSTPRKRTAPSRRPVITQTDCEACEPPEAPAYEELPPIAPTTPSTDTEAMKMQMLREIQASNAAMMQKLAEKGITI